MIWILSRFFAIEYSLAKLTKLEYLDIRDNAFSTLPAIVCSLTSLKEIDVQYCLLKDLPAKYVLNLKCNIRIKKIKSCYHSTWMILYCIVLRLCNMMMMSMIWIWLSIPTIECYHYYQIKFGIIFPFSNLTGNIWLVVSTSVLMKLWPDLPNQHRMS